MHSHRNDARILRAYGIRLKSVIDTALCDALSRGKALHQGRNLGEALKDTLEVELPHKATMPRDERGIFRKRPAAPQTIEYCAHDVLYSVALGMEQRSRILQAACGSDVLDVAYAASDRCSDSCLGRATSHKATARSGTTAHSGAPCHRRAARHTVHPARVPSRGSGRGCRAERS